MATLLKFTAVFKGGGLTYGALELLFRGRTHWTMTLAGGISAVLLYLISMKSRDPLWKKWIMGGAAITTVEFVTGLIVNILLGWKVWSYSDSWLNLHGQICLLFSLMWVVLSVPGIWIMAFVGRRVFKEGRKI